MTAAGGVEGEAGEDAGVMDANLEIDPGAGVEIRNEETRSVAVSADADAATAPERDAIVPVRGMQRPTRWRRACRLASLT